MPFVIVELDAAGDNRPLGVSGSFLLTATAYGESDIAEFRTVDAAHEAANRAPNRRSGHQLFIPGAGKPVGRDRHQLEHPGVRA